jgi:hypothetical protein
MIKKIAIVVLCLMPTINVLGSNLYLDLMKMVLINSIYQDPGAKAILDPQKIKFAPYNHEQRIGGRDWPQLAHTMVGLKRLENIQFCAEDIIKRNVRGDFIETGVWRGGSTIFMRAILKAYDITDRRVWVADSFEGLPVPNTDLYPIDGKLRFDRVKYLAVSLEDVKNNFKKYNLLDDQVVFLKGWFKDTIPNAAIKEIALLRLDGDMYESTIDVLNHLYPKLSIGGYIIIDDYKIQACRKAVEDYRARHKITEKIIDIDGVSAYWKKEK